MLRAAAYRVETAVSASYGPRGGLRMGQRGGAVMELRDGRLIIESLGGADPGQARLLRSLIDACHEHERTAGDGRKSLALLWAHGLLSALDAIHSGASAPEVAAGLRSAATVACEYFEASALPLNESDRLRVAQAAAGDDETLGRVVCEALAAAGEHGMVELHTAVGAGAPSIRCYTSTTFNTTGPLARYLVEMGVNVPIELPGALVAVARGPVNSMNQVLRMLEACATANRPLLFVTDSLEGEAYATISENVKRRTLQCATVRLSSLRDAEGYRDVAMACGARFIDRDELAGRGFPPDALGECKMATIYGDRFELEIASSQYADLVSYAVALKNATANEENVYRADVVARRVALMLGKYALITIPAVSEAERQRLTSLIGDSLSSVNAAFRNGVLPGGGAAYLRAAMAIRSEEWVGKSERAGAEALASGLSKLLEDLNGPESADEVRSELQKSRTASYDIRRGCVVDAVAEGPLDAVATCCSLVRRAADALARAVLTRTLELPAGGAGAVAALEGGS